MRAKLFLALALVASFTMAPAVAADTTESGSVSTGEVDSYPLGGFTCPDVITTWTVTLTLEDPSATDVVSLTVEGTPGAGAGVATQLNPTTSVSFTQNHGCLPAAQVTGILAEGGVDYTLTFSNS